MTGTEWRSVLALGLVYALRMAGMFMVLPLLALYAPTLQGGATTEQIGWAIGLYGLANAALQIPLGILSDRIGRKPVIYMGLLVFAAGSVVAGLGHDIETIQLGRLIQGLGAVSSATQGLLADVTRDQVRTIAMSIVGAGVGLAFAGAMIAGPIIAAFTGLNGLFFITAALTLVAIPIVAFGVPTPVASPPKLGGLMATFLDWKLMRLDVGILLLQAVMSGLFVVLPVTIVATLHLPKEQLWKLYLPVLAVSIIPAFGAIAWAEAHRRVPQVFIAGIVLLAGSLCLLTEMYASIVGLVASVFLFFTAFNFLEGTVPSLVSRLAPPSRKGAALGIYTTAQFLGVGLGSWVVGYADTSYGLTGAFAACALMPIVWLVVHSIGSRIVVGGDHGTAVPAGRES